MSHEFDDPELIKAIEDFLRCGRKVDSQQKETASLADIRPEWRELVSEMFVQNQELDDFLHQLQDVPMERVSRETAVVTSDELAELARKTVQLVLTSGLSDFDRDNVYLSWRPTSPFKAFFLALKGNAVPNFLSANVILFENYLSGNIEEDKPRLAEALGIHCERPTGSLTISSHIGALTDPQTRKIMEHAVLNFPEAPEITQHAYTGYYFFGNCVGKVVNLPPELLGERVIVDEIDHRSRRALSEVTVGDLVIAKTGLLAVERALISQLA